MHKFEIETKLYITLQKIFKKDKKKYAIIWKKINEIINSETVEHYKNLRYDLGELRRVHIGHFVLVFRFNKEENMIYFEDFEHHDKIYKKRCMVFC